MNKKGKKFSDIIVTVSVLAVTIFTIAAFTLQFLGKMEISSTLTGCWFAFWTTEIIVLATIKNSKTKYGESEVCEEENYCDEEDLKN